jgi:hypothetical protein
MSSSTIDEQIQVYEQLCLQQQTLRREHQNVLLESLQRLHDDVHAALNIDRNLYATTKTNFHRKFHRLQRVWTTSASNYRNSTIRPLKYVYLRRQDLFIRVTDLLDQTRRTSSPIDIRTHWNGSIAVVYNPTTGHTEWRQYRHGGIHGVYNPSTRTVEWECERHTGVYGVFNPQLNIVEWKRSFDGGVHGVYNPSTKLIEWRVSFHSGIGGVYNPLTEEVEWKTSYKGGVVGYFDVDTQSVKWIEKWHHGLAIIMWNSMTNSYVTSASCGWYANKANSTSIVGSCLR